MKLIRTVPIYSFTIVLAVLGGLAIGFGFSQILDESDKVDLNTMAGDAIFDLLPLFLVFGPPGFTLWLILFAIFQFGVLHNIRNVLEDYLTSLNSRRYYSDHSTVLEGVV